MVTKRKTATEKAVAKARRTVNSKRFWKACHGALRANLKAQREE